MSVRTSTKRVAKQPVDLSASVGTSSKVSKRAKSTFREASVPEAIEKEVNGIVHWGKDNLHGQYLVALREDNPIHGGIINQKVVFMTAGGFDISEQFANLITPELIHDCFDDFETFNGIAVLFTRDSVEKNSAWKAKHVDFETVRFCKEKHYFAISDDWSQKSQSEAKTNYKPRVRCLSKVVLTGEDADKEVLLYYRVKPKQRKLLKGVSLCYYPVPVYKSAIVSISAGIEQDYFTFSETVNGYKGGTLISLNNGVPETPEKADEIADEIKGEATDRDRQGGITVVFADGADNAATVASLNGNDLDKRYIESGREIRSKTMVGHSAGSPTLFAVNSENAFGSKEEMEISYTLFSNNYVKGRQLSIANVFTWAIERLGLGSLSLVFKKYVLTTSQEATDDGRVLKQLNSMSPLVATKVLESMTREEIRALAGLAPKEVQSGQNRPPTDVVNYFATIGVSRSDVVVLNSRTFDLNSKDDTVFALQNFTALTESQQLILKLIADGKSFSEVSKALGKGALALSLELIKLNAKGVLKGWKVVDISDVKLRVLYSYEVKTGLGAPIIPGSREFCEAMIKLDRLYTREEIETLGTRLGLEDVWRYRGGWYTNPETGKTTPSCRHEWRQNVIK
jgi:hypothetical protein